MILATYEISITNPERGQDHIALLPLETLDSVNRIPNGHRIVIREDALNTADDLADLEIGPNGKTLTLQRKIEFTPFFLPGPPPIVDPNMRQVAITIEYGSGNQKRTYQEVTYISSYR